MAKKVLVKIQLLIKVIKKNAHKSLVSVFPL